MRIALINGSPKLVNSSSEIIINTLITRLKDNNTVFRVDLHTSKINNQNLEELKDINAMVIVFPLYVDGIPSHILECLIQMEAFFKTSSNRDINVYTIVNCGFFEGSQTSIAIDMIENWCIRSGIIWKQGLGVGGGGMLSILSGSTEGKGPWNNLWSALDKLSLNILTKSSGNNIFISPNMPRFIYKIGGNRSWRQKSKNNGLTYKDLFARK